MTDAVPSGMRAAFEALADAVAGVQKALGAQPGPAAGAESALRCLAGAVDVNQAALDSELFPAMFEAVAGSDPVCIRDMQRSLSEMQRELTRRLVRVGAEPDAGTLQKEQLISECAQYMAYQREEVFPMAERMLPGN